MNTPFFNDGGAIFTEMTCRTIQARTAGIGRQIFRLRFSATASEHLRAPLYSEIGTLKSATPKFTRLVDFQFAPRAANTHTVRAEVGFRVVYGGAESILEIDARFVTWEKQVDRLTLIEIGAWLGDVGAVIMTPVLEEDELGLDSAALPVTVHYPSGEPEVFTEKPCDILESVGCPAQTSIDDDPADFIGSAGEGDHA